jgi:hypothetical protein
LPKKLVLAKNLKNNIHFIKEKKRLMCLKRQEAIELLKEIVAATKSVNYTQISLNPPSEKVQMKSEGYELHVKNHFDEADWQSLKTVIQKRGLSMQEYDGYIVIYKPRKE